MKTKISLFTLILTFTVLNANAQLQQINESRWGFEISSGASYGVENVGDAELNFGHFDRDTYCHSHYNTGSPD